MASGQQTEEVIRTFKTGATRDSEAGKPDYEGFLSPRVIERYGRYMNRHRLQADGSIRDSDNWQHGMPLHVYMKSLWRHFLDVWKIHRGLSARDSKTGDAIDIEDACCAVMFNAMGYLHETLKQRERP
jgi:hypothetical protein